MNITPWPTAEVEPDTLDDRALPPRWQRRLLPDFIPSGLQLRLPFEPDLDNDLGEPDEAQPDRNANV